MIRGHSLRPKRLTFPLKSLILGVWEKDHFLCSERRGASLSPPTTGLGDVRGTGRGRNPWSINGEKPQC